jgi:nucleotide-binding universal stress UspA family protein
MERQVSIRRVLIALDASPSSLAALEAAAELAAALDAELSGLFVEDANLLRVAEMPSARVLGSYSGRRLTLGRRDMERGLRAQARRARGALAAAAQEIPLSWSFRVARGTVAPEILAAVSESSLVVLGKTGRSGSRFGSTARAVAADAAGPVLIAGHGARRGSTVAVLYDGSPASERALGLAARLARKRRITVLVSTGGAQDALSSLAARAKEGLAERGISADYVEHRPGDTNALARALNREDAGLLLLGGAHAAEAAALVEETGCPVLLMR